MSILGKESAYLTKEAVLRKSASDEAKVQKPGTNMLEVNWVATLYRGERVDELEHSNAWTRVRISDDKVGWVWSESLLPAENVTLATVDRETRVFERPDILALDPKNTISAGTLLLVTKTGTPSSFVKANYSGTAAGFFLSEDLLFALDELEASSVINRACALKGRNPGEARALWDLAKTKFAGTKLVRRMMDGSAAPKHCALPVPSAVEQPEALIIGACAVTVISGGLAIETKGVVHIREADSVSGSFYRFDWNAVTPVKSIGAPDHPAGVCVDKLVDVVTRACLQIRA